MVEREMFMQIGLVISGTHPRQVVIGARKRVQATLGILSSLPRPEQGLRRYLYAPYAREGVEPRHVTDADRMSLLGSEASSLQVSSVISTRDPKRCSAAGWDIVVRTTSGS